MTKEEKREKIDNYISSFWETRSDDWIGLQKSVIPREFENLKYGNKIKDLLNQLIDGVLGQFYINKGESLIPMFSEIHLHWKYL